MPRGVDVAVHHRRARAQSDLVRGADDLDPQRGGQLALGQHPAHLVVEDLGRRSGDGVQPGLTQALQPLPDAQAGAGDPIGDLHGRERVHVHRGHPGFDRADQIGVSGDGQFRVDTALHAHLGRPGDVRLPRPVGHLLGRQRERIGIALALGEGTEPAAGVADVGEVDVAVHHERHVVADGVAAQRIGKGGNGIQGRAVGGGQRQILAIAAAAGISFGGAQRGHDVGVDALRGAGGQFADPVADRLPVAEGVTEIAAGPRAPPLGVDGRVKVGAPQRLRGLVGLLPRPAHRVDVARQAGVRVGQRRDVGLHPGIDPGRPGLDVARLRGQPLHQIEAALGGHRGQFVQRGPRPLGIDVVGGQR